METKLDEDFPKKWFPAIFLILELKEALEGKKKALAELTKPAE